MALTKTGCPKGRKRDVDAVGALGLVLYWYRTRGSVAQAISLAFSLTSTPMYQWLKFSRHVVLYVLQHHPSAKVRLPTVDELREYRNAIATKYPMLGEHRVWGTCDGSKLLIEQSTNFYTQILYFNGWTHDHYVNSVFVFCPDGRIRITTINAPGAWHDCIMADYGVYDKMDKLYKEHLCKVVIDSAFRMKGKDFLIQSSNNDPDTTREAYVLNERATSLRQLSEHGMRQIQAQFPRLKDKIKFEEFGERKVILNLMVLLYNFNTAEIGINEIPNSFMSKTKGVYNYKDYQEYDLPENANDYFF